MSQNIFHSLAHANIVRARAHRVGAEKAGSTLLAPSEQAGRQFPSLVTEVI